MKNIFDEDLFHNFWKLDENCYNPLSEEMYYKLYDNISLANRIFVDTKNKMQAASEHLIKDFFRFDDSMRKRERVHLANKENMKKDYMSFLENIISALNTGLIDNTRYGEGLEVLKTILDRYPEEKDEIIHRALPFLKQGGNRLKTAQNDMEYASLARGMTGLAASISDTEPELARVVLPIFNHRSIQYGLSLDVSDSDIRKAEYTTDGYFKPEYFLKNWQIDKKHHYNKYKCNEEEYNQFFSSSHKSINLFKDTQNKMQAAVNDVLMCGKFCESLYECEINNEISKEEAKRQYLKHFDDVVMALNTDMATGESYHAGLMYLADMLENYPEEDTNLAKTIPFLKKAYKKLEKAEDDNEKAFLAEGIAHLASGISTVQPDLAEFVLPYLKSDKVQSGLKINPYRDPEDEELDELRRARGDDNNYRFSHVCKTLGNMLKHDSSLLAEIKDISTAYMDCSGYADLQKEMQKVEQRTIILNSKYKSK